MGSRCFSAALQYKENNVSIKGCISWKAKSQVKNFIKQAFALMFAVYLMVVMVTNGSTDIEHCLLLWLISKGLRNYQFLLETAGHFFIICEVEAIALGIRTVTVIYWCYMHVFKSTFRYLALNFCSPASNDPDLSFHLALCLRGLMYLLGLPCSLMKRLENSFCLLSLPASTRSIVLVSSLFIFFCFNLFRIGSGFWVH